METVIDKNADSVELIRIWMDNQPHLPKIDEKMIQLFLHSNYYRLPETKATIENYFTFRTNCTNFFTNQDPQSAEMKQVMEYLDFTPLPKPTPEGYRIALIRLSDTNASLFSQVQACKFMTMCLDLWLQEDGLAEGHIMVYDMTGANLGHLARLGVFATKNYLYYIQEALPIRIKGFHFVNTVSFMDKILFLMKPFLKKELFDVLKLHSDDDSLFQLMPRECFPNEYGGAAGEFKQLKDNFYFKLNAYRDQFLINEAYQKVDEGRRTSTGVPYLSKTFKFISSR